LKYLGLLGRQATAGLIVGLSAVIYAISYGALLFSGPLADYVGFGITIALITAVIGGLFGALSEERTFFSGPDSNTVSVLASVLAVMSATMPGPQSLTLAVATVVLTSLLCAGAFLLVVRANLSGLVRYIPFAVMAGFLASTGWLMSSGALNIIAGTPLTLAGLERLLSDPLQPQLAFGIFIAVPLFILAPRVSNAVLIPLVMFAAALFVNVFLASSLCGSCDRGDWMFAGMGKVQWLAPWNVDWPALDVGLIIENLPAMLVVSFVGLLTILLSVASLELSFQKEFDLNRVLKTHALFAGASALLGGFVGIISIGRTTLNRQAGGGALAGATASVICLAMLLGAGAVISLLPKAALGGLVLYLGLNLLKQWLWDRRRTISRVEFAQIFLILTLVANYGFLVGFAAGLLISCIVFVVTYSRVPLADLATNLSLFASSVVRPDYEAETLRDHGERTLLYRLSGYVFFGSASKIEAVFQTLKDGVDGVVLDFTKVSGIDSSAVGVFQRILRRYRHKPTRFYVVTSPDNDAAVRTIGAEVTERITYFPSLDHAVETAEEDIIAAWNDGGDHADLFAFLHPDMRATFASYCVLQDVVAGGVLCAEHDRADAMFFIAAGSFEVLKGAAALRLAKLHKGAMIGELAFYSGETRTASIVAVTDSAVYVLNKASLERLRADHPALATTFDHMVIRKIGQTLARTNTLLTMFR
jgi:SulP family sulfate permease